MWLASIEKVVVEAVLVRALRCIAQGGCILPLELTPLYSSSLQVLACCIFAWGHLLSSYSRDARWCAPLARTSLPPRLLRKIGC